MLFHLVHALPRMDCVLGCEVSTGMSGWLVSGGVGGAPSGVVVGVAPWACSRVPCAVSKPLWAELSRWCCPLISASGVGITAVSRLSGSKNCHASTASLVSARSSKYSGATVASGGSCWVMCVVAAWSLVAVGCARYGKRFPWLSMVSCVWHVVGSQLHYYFSRHSQQPPASTMSWLPLANEQWALASQLAIGTWWRLSVHHPKILVRTGNMKFLEGKELTAADSWKKRKTYRVFRSKINITRKSTSIVGPMIL